MNKTCAALTLAAMGCGPLAWSQLVVTTAPTPTQLVQNVLLGGGVTASNITYSGDVDARGSFTAVNSNLGLDAGVIMASGMASDAANPASNFASTGFNFASVPDADLEAISGFSVYDPAILEFDFIPTGDTLRFRYVFGSEEYPGYTCASVNDVFGFFLSGPGIAGPFSNNSVNLAVVPNTSVPISINTVNSGTPSGFNDGSNCANADPNWQANSIYFVDNETGATVTYDGFTVVMTAWSLVQCGQQYHIKMAIADGGDSVFDSGVFIEAGSFTSTGQVVPSLSSGAGVVGNTMLEGCPPVELVFTRLGDSTVVDTIDISISGTATPGVDYTPALPSQLVFPVGVDSLSFILSLPIDGDGPETLIITIQQLIQCAGVVVQSEFTFNIDSPPPLDVQSTDINGICGETHLLAPVVAGGLGQYVYDWSTGEDTPTITVGPAVTTTYTVIVTDICGILPDTADFTVTLPIYPPLQMAVTGDTLIDCLGTGPIEVFSQTGGDGVYAYEWTLGGQVVGGAVSLTVPAADPAVQYVVTMTDGCGSSIQDSVLVGTVPLEPIMISTAGDQTPICAGDTVTLTILGIVGGNGVYNWRWADQSGVVLGNGWTIDVPATGSTPYTITANDQCGYEGTASVSAVAPVYAPFLLDVGQDKLLCAGDSTTIHAQVSGGSGYYTILWSGVDSLSDPLYWVMPDSETDYAVTVTDQCGEVRSDEMTIEVEHVHIDIVETNQGQDDWYLQAQTLPYAQHWVWDMGDGTRYRQDEVYHSYLDLEEHWVTLKIITPNGCLGEDSVLLKPPAHIYFPNAFTPDGDGINEFFGPAGHYIETFEMTVFDRWGEVVFTSKDFTIPWDGTVNGSTNATTGVYVYTYHAEGHYFPPVDGIGHVTLIRGSQD